MIGQSTGPKSPPQFSPNDWVRPYEAVEPAGSTALTAGSSGYRIHLSFHKQRTASLYAPLSGKWVINIPLSHLHSFLGKIGFHTWLQLVYFCPSRLPCYDILRQKWLLLSSKVMRRSMVGKALIVIPPRPLNLASLFSSGS